MKSSAKIATDLLHHYITNEYRLRNFGLPPYIRGGYLEYPSCFLTKTRARRIFGTRSKYFMKLPTFVNEVYGKDADFIADGMIALEHLPPDFPEVFNALKELHPDLQS